MSANRTLRRLAALAFVLVSTASGQPLPAGGDYRITASTIDGGTPHTSADAGTGFVLRGTIGQTDAAASSAGSVRLEGGFWPAGKAPRGAAIFADGFESP